MFQKQIAYDRQTKDFAMYLDGELTGYARTYLEAEISLNELAYELLSQGYFPTNHETQTDKQEVLNVRAESINTP